MKAIVFLFIFLFLATALAANTCGDSNRICTIDTAIESDTTWVDGNTYFIVADNNLSVLNGALLTIEPGAVIKFGRIGNGWLIAEDGGWVKAQGTAEKPIVFTSCRDQNYGVNTSDQNNCAGAPALADYQGALYFSETATVRADANDFSYLNIRYSGSGSDAINVGAAIQSVISIHSIHDSNLMYNAGGAANGALSIFGNVDLVYNNWFVENTSDIGGGICVYGTVGSIYGNRFVENEKPAIYTTGTIGSIHDNNFSDNLASPSAIYIAGGSIDSIYSNIFVNNSDSDLGSGTVSVSGSINSVYNNLFIGNTGSAFMIGDVEIGGFWNNTFFGNTVQSIFGVLDAISEKPYNVFNNVFAYNTGYAIMDEAETSFVNGFVNYNVYVGNENNTNLPLEANSVYLTESPFLGDGSDRNFLLNARASGGARLVNAGFLDVNAFFAAKTTQLSNELDLGRIDIGYHYDANGTYVPPEVNLPGDSKIKCGNNLCESSETAINCPVDCSAVCGDSACTHTENFSTCSVDCAVGCGNKVCEATEDPLSCPLDCSPIVRVLSSEELNVISHSPVDLAGLGSLVSALGIASDSVLSNALARVRVERRFVVESVEENGRVFSRTRVVLKVVNVSGVPLKEILLFELLPKVVESKTVSSEYPFSSIENANAVSFSVPGLLPSQSVEVSYLFPLSLSAPQAQSFAVPFAASVLESSVLDVTKTQCVSNADCSDDNLCTANRCINGSCFAVGFPDGEVCELGSVCKSGVCTSITQKLVPETGFDPIWWFSIVVIGVAVVVIGYEAFFK